MLRGRARRELFAPDRGLEIRMLVVSILTPLLVLACLVAVAELAPLKLAISVGVALAVGVGVIAHQRAEASPGRPLHEHDAPALLASVERLCALADLPKPEILLVAEAQPNSWIVGLRSARSRLYVTDGLLELLPPDELDAVVGHELAHVAHRDAAVMTAVGGPGEALVHGGKLAGRGGFWPLQLGALLASAIGLVSTVGTRSLSRHRELAADAGSAALTGRPASLASALRRISGGLAAIPTADLREAAARDAFHLLSAGDAAPGLKGRLAATHPPLQERLARLERLEHALRAGHLPSPS